VREARSRLARTLRNGRRETEGRTGDRRNWSEQASEGMAVLKGLNTVGCLVTFLFLVFIFASAKGSRQIKQYPNYPVPPPYQVSQSVPLDQQQQQWNPSPQQGQWNNAPSSPQQLPPPGQLPNSQSPPWAVPSIAQQQQAQGSFGGAQQGLPPPGNSWQQPADPHLPPPAAEECCPCTGPQAHKDFGKNKGGDNLSMAAATLGGLMWAGSHIPQCLSMWKTRDISSFSFLSLFLQLGASVLVFIYASLQANFLLATFGVWNAACFGFYVWVYVKHPPGCAPGAERSGLIYSEADEDGIDDDGL